MKRCPKIGCVLFNIFPFYSYSLQGLSAIDMDNDGQVDWKEFALYLKWAGRQYPETETADDLLDIAFRKGLIPAMQDVILKVDDIIDDGSSDSSSDDEEESRIKLKSYDKVGFDNAAKMAVAIGGVTVVVVFLLLKWSKY